MFLGDMNTVFGDVIEDLDTINIYDLFNEYFELMELPMASTLYQMDDMNTALVQKL